MSRAVAVALVVAVVTWPILMGGCTPARLTAYSATTVACIEAQDRAVEAADTREHAIAIVDTIRSACSLVLSYLVPDEGGAR